MAAPISVRLLPGSGPARPAGRDPRAGQQGVEPGAARGRSSSTSRGGGAADGGQGGARPVQAAGRVRRARGGAGRGVADPPEVRHVPVARAPARRGEVAGRRPGDPADLRGQADRAGLHGPGPRWAPASRSKADRPRWSTATASSTSSKPATEPRGARNHTGPDLLLARHGQSTWNADGRWQGRADPPLSELGERQAEAVIARLQAEAEAGRRSVGSGPRRCSGRAGPRRSSARGSVSRSRWIPGCRRSTRGVDRADPGRDRGARGPATWPSTAARRASRPVTCCWPGPSRRSRRS